MLKCSEISLNSQNGDTHSLPYVVKHVFFALQTCRINGELVQASWFAFIGTLHKYAQ